MKIHMVKKGDTLYFIGQKYNVSLEEILKLNPGITNPDAIEVGMKLKIPSSHTGGSGGMDIMHQHVVKQGDTLWKLSKAWGVPLADMIKANPQLKNPNVLLTGEIVNIPKAGGVMPEVPANPGTVGAQSTNPNSLMQNVQGWVGKKISTSPILGKAPTGPIAGKTPTAPITQLAPVAPEVPVTPPKVAPITPPQAAPVTPPKAAPIQEKKPTAPSVKPVAPAEIPAPKPMAIEPAKKTLPIQKPVENKLAPIHSEYKPNVDLFKQYGIPATEAMSLYDLPKAPEAVSPAAQQPTYGGYGYGQPMTMAAHTGPGYGYGYGGWHQPVPFSNTVSPLGDGNDSFECPPGTVLVGSYPSPSTMPFGAGPDWGYGNPMVSPLQQGVGENNMLAGASTMPNQGMVSPYSAMPNQGMVSPYSEMPNQGMVSPLSAMPNQGMVSPYSEMPNQGMVSPYSAMPNQGMVSPYSAMPNQGMVSPYSEMPNQGMVSPYSAMPNQGMVSPYSEMPNQGMVSPYSEMPNQGMVSPYSAMPNQGMVSPYSEMPNQGMVSPYSAMPNQGMVSPYSEMPNQGMVSPYSEMPNQGMVSPFSAMPNQGMVSPYSTMPNQGMVSPYSAMPNQGMVSPYSATPNQGMVSPAYGQPEYDHGYGGYGYGQGMVSPSYMQPESGYGYGSGLPPYPSYPGGPLTAGVGKNKKDCGCHGDRTEQSIKLADTETEAPKSAKTGVQRKNAKKAVIRTVTTRQNRRRNRGSQPWLNN